MTDTTTLPELPHWETPPHDIEAAIVATKSALRARIEAATGSSVTEVVGRLEAELQAEVDEIVATRDRGQEVWPVIEYADIEANQIDDDTRSLVKRRGCAVIRGLFPAERALQWDQDVVNYLDRNDFFNQYRGPGDDFFATVDSKPEIYPIYWSRAQVEARQDPRMAVAQSFLNSFWTSETDGTVWFEPDRSAVYPDRIRRRPPGTTSGGLGAHLDPGTLDLWMTQGYQAHFAPLFRGDLDAYDPWNAAHRTEAAQYPGSTMCSAFRTFQGWTALSEMRRDQGVLFVIPIPRAMAYVMLRPLLDDVPEAEMCGVALNRTVPVNDTYHSLLLPAKSLIPDVQPGDSVWWHSDIIHGVAPVEDQQGWGNVMYIPAAPWCTKNAAYAQRVLEAMTVGHSPGDFPDEHYEADWTGRLTPDDLNTSGRLGVGLDPVASCRR